MEPDTWENLRAAKAEEAVAAALQTFNFTNVSNSTNSSNSTNATKNGSATILPPPSSTFSSNTAFEYRPDSKRIAPVLSLVLLTFAFTMSPLIEHFNTLRNFYDLRRHAHLLYQSLFASVLHCALHAYVWQIWQNGVVNLSSLATLLSFLIMPSMVRFCVFILVRYEFMFTLTLTLTL